MIVPHKVIRSAPRRAKCLSMTDSLIFKGQVNIIDQFDLLCIGTVRDEVHLVYK